MEALLWLLLPLAAASGWWTARYTDNKKKAASRAVLNSAYGQGLNHLLNEEPDKATEVLVQMVAVDPDTVELHLALGSLFRRRGEVDRAIRVHENVVERSGLSQPLRMQAMLELGRDFFKAGLLDRAEQLFQSLLDKGYSEKEVCQHLIDLYQHEKEWQKALEIGERLQRMDPGPWLHCVAQYHCELAELALKDSDSEAALEQVRDALELDPDCVRATLLEGAVYQHSDDYQRALQTYQAVETQNPDLLPEVVEAIHGCYTRLGDADGWRSYFKALVERHPHLVFSFKTSGDHPVPGGKTQSARYCCEECGFASRKLFWQCPGCQSWSSVKPIRAGNSE
jgi:lipopolysaccharide biosynthesis regulator YciM